MVSEDADKGLVPIEEGDGTEEPREATPPGAEPLEGKSREEIVELFLLARADLENARRRFRQRSEEIRGDATASIVRDLLPVLDSFERALLEREVTQEFREGVVQIHRQLLGLLERSGLREVEAEGLPFDPERHEAIEVVEREGREPGDVTEVLQRGYRLGERLLRPARVRVAKAD